MVFRTGPDGSLLGNAVGVGDGGGDGVGGCALQLYYEWRSTSSRRVRIVLHEKRLDWEGLHIEKGEENENYLPWYTALNPLGVVPTLLHGDRVIIESNVINEYLEDVFPEFPLRPDDPYEKARMRVWLIRSENEAHDAINPISEIARGVRKARFSKEQRLKQVEVCPHPGRRALKVGRVVNGISESVIETSHLRIAWLLEEMEKSLEDGPWLAGSTYSLADISMAPFMERFIANDIPEIQQLDTRLPLTGEWWARIQARPSYQFVMSMKSPEQSDPFKDRQI